MSAAVRLVIIILAGIILVAGLPVVGWDVTDWAGFAAHPARLGYVLLVVALQIFVAIKFPRVGQNSGDGKKVVERQRLAVILLQVFSIAIIIAAPYSDRREIAVLSNLDGVRYAGLVLFAAGFIGVSWAEAWTQTVQPPEQVVAIENIAFLVLIVYAVWLLLRERKHSSKEALSRAAEPA